jgi:hypothetical protein
MTSPVAEEIVSPELLAVVRIRYPAAEMQ